MKWVSVGLAACLLVVSPNASMAQEGFEPALRVRARLGVVTYDSGGCGRGSGWIVGFDVRTRGPLILSGAVDFVVPKDRDCSDVLPLTSYQGQIVEIWGTTTLQAPRPSAWVGYAIPMGALRSEIAAGAGILGNRTDYVGSLRVQSWQPWFAGMVTLRAGDSGPELQLEIGRHRIPIRYYDAYGGGGLVAEVLFWKPLVRVAVAFRLGG